MPTYVVPWTILVYCRYTIMGILKKCYSFNFSSFLISYFLENPFNCKNKNFIENFGSGFFLNKIINQATL